MSWLPDLPGGEWLRPVVLALMGAIIIAGAMVGCWRLARVMAVDEGAGAFVGIVIGAAALIEWLG